MRQELIDLITKKDRTPEDLAKWEKEKQKFYGSIEGTGSKDFTPSKKTITVGRKAGGAPRGLTKGYREAISVDKYGNEVVYGSSEELRRAGFDRNGVMSSIKGKHKHKGLGWKLGRTWTPYYTKDGVEVKEESVRALGTIEHYVCIGLKGYERLYRWE